ncbi:MAG: aminoacetone oxidase family FAD-binding enzyme [Candidatus Aminicenantes bacterium]|nr:aminoacetone oxidase family FAD-binding enzyme [Candidatus Aminicenantes bacterium]
MTPISVAVVGGGAAGLAAAVGAARAGAHVSICERMPGLGRKLLATGGGRCNLLNERLESSAFTPEGRDLVRAVFDRFGKDAIRSLLEGLGLALTSEADRIFPATQQAASVLKAFEIELRRLAVDIRTTWDVRRLGWKEGRFVLEARGGGVLCAERVVLAGGGKSYPAFGADGNAYGLAGAFGHGLVEPVPSAVPVVVKDRLCHLLQGQKIRGRAASFVGGRQVEEAEGEILFTAYGLSGTAVLDVSESLSRALNRERCGPAELALDLLPRFSREDLTAELGRRRALGWKDRELTTGLLPEKFGAAVESWVGSAPGAEGLAGKMKDLRFKVAGTRGWNEAEFTSGGIPVGEVDPGRLESRLRTGLFLAGEILDVQGRRGGFNLSWAWASGWLAGRGGMP